jgi:DNA-binding MarR family transcriptional regulator
MKLSRQQPRLTDPELDAWRGFLRAHATITRQLDADLIAGHGLSLSDYEVMLLLVQAPERQLRMSRLAEQVVLTRSGITRLVTRLEEQGLVERVCCAVDRRGFNAHLTDAGLSRLREAASTHLAGIRRLFVEPLGDDLPALAAGLERLPSGGDPPGQCSPEPAPPRRGAAR